MKPGVAEIPRKSPPPEAYVSRTAARIAAAILAGGSSAGKIPRCFSRRTAKSYSVITEAPAKAEATPGIRRQALQEVLPEFVGRYEENVLQRRVPTGAAEISPDQPFLERGERSGVQSRDGGEPVRHTPIVSPHPALSSSSLRVKMEEEETRMPLSQKELTRAQFGRVASKYRCSADHTDVEDLDLLFTGLALDPAHRVLDVATGGGHTAAALAGALRQGGGVGPDPLDAAGGAGDWRRSAGPATSSSRPPTPRRSRSGTPPSTG